MMKVTVRLALFLMSALVAPAQSVNGLWDAAIQYDDYKIPFPLQLSQKGSEISASFFNGNDPVTSTAGVLTGNSLTVRFDHYATQLSATLADGALKGTYGSKRYGFHDFEAKPHVDVTAAAEGAPDISGVWDLPNESPKGEHAWRLIIKQNGPEASAAILRVDGDTGSLQGSFQNGKFVLNHFDGARASVLEIVPKPDGSLDVALKGFHSPAKHFTAVRLTEAAAKGLPQPADPETHTRMKSAKEPFRFRFPDLNGQIVSNTDKRFQDKVVIVNVTGSWCPNCHDEAPFLAELYRKYHAQGLEIVALDFEEPEQRADPTRLRAFIRKYGIDYSYLIAGEPQELQAKLPQVENLNSWPTTFFLGRDGVVRAIHAGFAAPASGPFHAALRKDVTERIERLLSENVRASR